MTDEITKRIALIGYGNIARSLLKGIRASRYKVDNISVSDPPASIFWEVGKQGKTTHIHTSNASAVEDATIAILCVKPDVVPAVCAEIKDALIRQSVLLVSVAAGVPLHLLQRWTTERTADHTLHAEYAGFSGLRDDRALCQSACIRCAQEAGRGYFCHSRHYRLVEG